MSDENKLPSGVVLHSGVELDPEMEFPIDAPPEIGELRTAQSTIGVKNINSIPYRIFLSLVGVLMFLPLVGGIIYALTASWLDNSVWISLGVGLAVGLAACVAIFIGTGPKKIMTFVGESGVVRYKFKHVELGPAKTEMLLFSQTNDLRTGVTENYSNGIYANTTYDYSWYDETGSKIFTEAGAFRGNSEGLPKKDIDPYFFGLSAERAYNEFATDRMAKEFEEKGVVEFFIHGFKKRDTVRVGDGYLEFDFKGNVDRVEADDIKRIRVEDGVFFIDTKDAKFFGRQGKFRFVYGKLSNAQLFLHALIQLGGFTIG